MANGLTPRMPTSQKRRALSIAQSRPPMPTPMAVPVRSSSGTGTGSPASARASRAAAMASCATRAIRRASLKFMYWAGSNPLTSPAICTGTVDESNRVMVSTPDRPATRPAHVLATSRPSGDTIPMPVMTTRVRSFLTGCSLVVMLRNSGIRAVRTGRLRAATSGDSGGIRSAPHCITRLLSIQLHSPARPVAHQVAHCCSIVSMARRRLSMNAWYAEASAPGAAGSMGAP